MGLELGADVSGGLDSSAIFAVAENLRRQGRLLAPEIKGYTYKFDKGLPAYELDYARAVAKHVGVPVQEILPFFPDLGGSLTVRGKTATWRYTQTWRWP